MPQSPTIDIVPNGQTLEIVQRNESVVPSIVKTTVDVETGSTIEVQENKYTVTVEESNTTVQIPSTSLSVVSVGTQGPRGPSLGESEIFTEAPTGQINGANVTFFLAHAPMAGTVTVKLNGVEIYENVDYTLSGQTLTLLIAPLTGDSLIVGYLRG